MNTDSDHTRKTQRTILIVDDDPVVTQSLNAFLSLETDYGIIESQSPREALELIKNTPVDLIITDFLMPGMNGLQFLTETKKLYPHVPRIMLTGYADKENAIRAINEVDIFQYIEKPWDNEQFLLIIHNAITTKSLRETLSKRIHELDTVLLDRGRLQERNELLKEELRQARQLQLSMLPESLPDTDGIQITAKYLPALDVGGDFYDVIPLAGNRVAVLVADATGHGIQAALSTAIVKFAFSHYAHSEAGPAEIVEGMNRILCSGLPGDTFAAAIVVVLDLGNAHCRMVNAGLPHPYRIRRARSDVERVFAEGLVLGAVDDTLYPVGEEMSIQLERGDALLFYTDGLSEVENENGEQFDKLCLRETLLEHRNVTSGDLYTALVDSSRRFSTENYKWDDITIVGIDLK